MLKEYYFLGMMFLDGHFQMRRVTKYDQKIANFLARYFHDDYGAIAHLEDVSPSSIERCRQEELEIIISSRTRKDIQGLNDVGAGELWQSQENTQDLYGELVEWLGKDG